MRLAWVAYGAVGVLSILFVPDKEMAAIFVFLLGYYPLLKAYLQRIRSKVAQVVLKFLIFNGSVLAMYSILLYIFPIQYLVEEFSESAPWMIGALLLMGNISFWIYDAALINILHLYVIKIKPKLQHVL